ncbi:MAG: thioredoxin family protein [Pseudomonadales bacterium]
MARTESNMLPLGTNAPDFELLDTLSGKFVSLQHLKSDTATVIMFICNHCPFVLHIKDELAQLALDYQPLGVHFAAISANDVVSHPQDGPDQMEQFAIENDFTFPYLYDESQTVAKDYQAACTPDFYIFNNSLLCVYRGQLDDSRPGNDQPVTGDDVRATLNALLAKQPVNQQQKPSLGCNIKWKS